MDAHAIVMLCVLGQCNVWLPKALLLHRAGPKYPQRLLFIADLGLSFNR